MGAGGLVYSLFAGCVAIPKSFATYEPTENRYTDIAVLRDEWQIALAWGVPTAILVLLAIGVLGARSRQTNLSLIAFVSTTVAFPAVVISFLMEPAPWSVGPEITDDAGRHYAFGESSFLQGQSLALVRYRNENTWYRTYDVLVVTNGDNPSHYLKIVRPAGMPKEDGQVYFADGWIIAVRFGNRSYTA